MNTGSLFEQKFRRAVKPAPLVKYFPTSLEFPDSMPVEKLHQFQLESIQEIVKRAYEHSTFYRERMDQVNVTPDEIQELGDLARLPFLTKDDLRGNPWVLLACDKEDVALVQVSTGTTGGEEIYIMNTWDDYYLNELTPGYPKLFPIQHGDVCFNSLPYEMSSAGLAFHKTFLEGCQATVVPAGKGGAYSTPEKTIKMMRDLQPTIVITTPSWAISLAEAAAESSFDLQSLPLRGMWLTGEGCSSSFRDRVEKIWGTTANFYYGSLECGVIGVECNAHTGYHISMGHSLVEIVDPDTGEVLEPGDIGEIIVSCTTRYDTPILRYRTKDLGYIDTIPCSCGCQLPRLFLRGRLADQIDVQGMSFSPYYLEEFLMRQPEVGNWFQFVVKSSGSDRVKVRCELASSAKPSEELADSLASKMEFAIGIPFEFEFVTKMPRPKEKTIRVVHED